MPSEEEELTVLFSVYKIESGQVLSAFALLLISSYCHKNAAGELMNEVSSPPFLHFYKSSD